MPVKNLLKIMLSFLFYSIVSMLSSSAYATLVISDNSLSLQLDRCSSPEVRDMVSESILNSGDVSVSETTENTALFKFRYPRNAIHENLTAQFILYNSNQNEITRSSSKALHGSTAGFISKPVGNIDEDKYYVFIAVVLNTDKKKYCTLESETVTITNELTNSSPSLIRSDVTPSNIRVNESVMFQSIWQDPDSDAIVDVKARYRKTGTSTWTEEILDDIGGDVATGYTFNKAVTMTAIGQYEVEFQATDSKNGSTQDTTVYQGNVKFLVKESSNEPPEHVSSSFSPTAIKVGENITFEAVWKDQDSTEIIDVTAYYYDSVLNISDSVILDDIEGDVKTGYTFRKTVPINAKGTYSVTFSASDNDGNTTYFSRGFSPDGEPTEFTVISNDNNLPKPEFKFSGNEIPQILFIGQSYEYSLSFTSDLTDKAKCSVSFYEEDNLILEQTFVVTNGQKIVDTPQASQVNRNYKIVCQTFTGNLNNPTELSEESVWEFQIKQEDNYSLNVVTENGSVTGEGINCPSDCTESYTQESTHVSLTATPNESYKFSEWSLGESCASTADLTQLTINISFSSDCAVTASFIDAASYPPLITSTDFPNCKSAGLEDIKCVKTGFEYNLSFFLTDVDGDLLAIEFEGYPNLDSKKISGSEVTLNEDIKFSNSLLSDCNSAWNMGLLDECWRKNITVKATVIDAKGYENTSEQTFTLYNLDKYWENETAIAKKKAQKDLDDLIAQKEHKNSAYIEFDEQYTELCVQEVYEPNFTNILIEDDKRREENGNPIYTDIGNEYLITYNSKIKNKHPYSIEVKYNFGEFGTGYNYPAIVTLKYDIIGYPNNDGSSHSKSFHVNNYSDKELAKKLLLQSVYNNLFVGQCNEVDFDTPQLSSYEQTPEELALTISPSTESLKRQIYGDSFVDIALDIANGVDPDVAKEHLFDAFSGIDLQSRISLMVSNRPQDKLFFEFISNDDYLEQDDIDLTFALYHMTKVQLDPEYVIPNESFYLEIAGTYAFDTALDIVFPFIFDLVTLGMVETADASVKGKFRSFTRINERLDKKIINPKTLAKGARNAKTYTSARRGRRVHKSWEDNKLYDEKFGKTHIHEFSIKHPTLKTKTGRAKGYRLDAIKFDKKNNRIELRELKPNNSNAIRKGKKQLQEYKEVMEYQVRNNPDMKKRHGKWISKATIIIKDVITYD